MAKRESIDQYDLVEIIRVPDEHVGLIHIGDIGVVLQKSLAMGAVTGAVFGMMIGALIPASVRMSANTEGMPVLDALVMGRFETAVLFSFLLSILATMVGAWVGGKNLVPRNL